MADLNSMMCQCGLAIAENAYYIRCICGAVFGSEFGAEPSPTDRVTKAREAGAKSRRIAAAVRRRSTPGEGYGTALDRFEQLAIRFNSPLAAELTLLLHICACDRSVAIATLNTSDRS